MKGRAIAFLVFLQVVTIGYGILLSGALCKIGDSLVFGGKPMPAGYVLALNLRDYGIWLVVPLLMWAVWACLHSSTARTNELSWQSIWWSGLGMSALFFFAGTVCALGALTPMICLLV